MKTKLEMAHDYAMLHMMNTQYKDVDDLEMVQWAFDYADAMKAEADKRECKERTDVLLTKDKDGNCLHFHHEFGHKKCMDCGASLEEWQPDWSQAPKNATHWGMELGSAYWLKEEGDHLFYKIGEASLFGYTGSQQDSLRKRPK